MKNMWLAFLEIIIKIFQQKGLRKFYEHFAENLNFGTFEKLFRKYLRILRICIENLTRN